jgi:putative endonuclease
MRAEPHFYVYILASRSRALYIGITSRLEPRLHEHRNLSEGFAAHYRCHRLVLLERYTHPFTAIAREKQLKRWNRAKKIALVETSNPRWEDLSAEWGRPIRQFSKDEQTADPSTALRPGRDDESSNGSHR